jgi:hypothetical protein
MNQNHTILRNYLKFRDLFQKAKKQLQKCPFLDNLMSISGQWNGLLLDKNV